MFTTLSLTEKDFTWLQVPDLEHTLQMVEFIRWQGVEKRDFRK